MEGLKFRVDGVYDIRTYNCLEEIGIEDFCFDLRPLSLSFVPLKTLKEILEISFRNEVTDLKRRQYCFHFNQAAPIEIIKMTSELESLYNLYHDHGTGKAAYLNSFKLEFSDQQERSYYDQFGIGYYWHFQGTHHLSQILKSPYLRGIVFPYQVFEEEQEKGQLVSFLKNLLQVIYRSENKSLEIILGINWKIDLLPAIFDHFDFDILSIPINDSIEVNYRNVDLNLMKDQLSHFKSRIPALNNSPKMNITL